ncbi:MAG: hypothetical protein Q8O67_29755 [Deltaproteobacteria bacterium]|nr:hypothetical protein [Deltaproteobacteria bacterium]
MPLLLIPLVFLVVFVGGLFLLSRLLRGLRVKGRTASEALTQGEAIVCIDEQANFFGVETKGAAQARGNGCLTATDQHLVFVQWVPRRDLVIRRTRIVAVERTRWHLGKSVGRDLLKVRFLNEEGQDDAVAFSVADLPAWERALSSTTAQLTAAAVPAPVEMT